MPPEEEWLANITNAKTRRAYKNDVGEFVAYAGLRDYASYAPSSGRISSTGARIWNNALCCRPPSGASSRRCPRLFDYLCERNAVVGNPGRRRQAAHGERQ